jgi:predicted flavoprotein YhiN
MSHAETAVLVIGGGPAGLRAAEVASAAGAPVMLCDAQPSVGRKFLVAGRGGLNLTHSEPVEKFPQRYGAEQERWADLLAEFGPQALQEWADELGVETYHGTSGRVFPRGQKAAGLLRAWIARLRASGVQFRMGARLTALAPEADGWRASFTQDGRIDDSSRAGSGAGAWRRVRGLTPAPTEGGPACSSNLGYRSRRGSRPTADGKSPGRRHFSRGRKACRSRT